MSFEVQGKGAAPGEATKAGPSTCIGIPTVNLANNQVALYYDIDPPGCWKRLRVFLRGLIFGFTVWFCCPAVKLASDDLTWGLRLSLIGRMLGGAIVGGLIGFGSVFLGCWAGSEIAVNVGDDDDESTGCRVGAWSSLALSLCFMILAAIRTIPKSVIRSANSTPANNDDHETDPTESK